MMAYLFQSFILETLFITHKNVHIHSLYCVDEDETLLQGTLLIGALSC